MPIVFGKPAHLRGAGYFGSSGMRIRVLRLALALGAASPVGCWTVPRPYSQDPLIHSEKRQRGSFEKAAQALPATSTEPLAPPAPNGLPEWVKTEPRSQ